MVFKTKKMKQQITLNCPYLVEMKKVRVEQIESGHYNLLLGFTDTEVFLQSQALSVIEENGARKLFCPNLDVEMCKKKEKKCPYV